MRRSLLALAAAALVGCATVNPVASTTTIEGRAAKATAIKLERDFSFRPALYSVTFPAGLYVAAFEDADGVYFRATGVVTKSTIFGGGTSHGGLYVPRTSWSSYKAYINDDGNVVKHDIPKLELQLVPAP